MSTVLDYYKYAVLATASYVRMGASQLTGADLAREANAQEDGRLPSVLAEKLFLRTETNPDVWNIVRYYGADMPAILDPVAAQDTSGFAATLFERGGEKILAIRGTEPVSDWGVDVGGAGIGQIGILGLALTQVVSMINLIQRMRAQSGAPAVQIKVNASLLPSDTDSLTVDGIPPMFLSFSTYTVAGIGGIEPGETIKVTGHSLGGHLAYMAARLFPGVVDPTVYAYNAAGYDPTTADFISGAGPIGIALATAAKAFLINEFGVSAGGVLPSANQLTESALALLVKALRGTDGTQGAPIVVNLRSEDIALGDDFSFVASPVTGAYRYPAAIDLPTEANSHVIEPLMDALALHALLYSLNNNLSLNTITRLLEAASPRLDRSEEALTEALYSSFLNNAKLPDGIQPGNLSSEELPLSDASAGARGLAGIGKGDLIPRAAFHEAVLRIGDAIKDKGYQLDPLVDVSGTSLGNLARGAQAVAHRYALKELNPFAVVDVSGELYARFQPAGTNAGELDLYDPVSRSGALNDEWITDRGGLLEAVLVANTQDNPEIARIPGSNDISTQYHYYAGGSERVLFADPIDRDSNLPQRTQVVMFGDDASRALIGFDFVLGDHLYGGLGTDYLEGRGGDDQLQGGKGLDLYTYTASTGLLASRNDGADTILDTDGKGVIRYSVARGSLFSERTTTVIAEATVKLSDTQWQDASGNFTYTKTPNFEGRTDLVVTINGDAGGSITLKDFRDGDFGIHLSDARVMPETAFSILGDFEPQDFDPATPGTQTQTDALGNVIVTSAAEPDRDDVLFGNRPDVIVNPAAAGERIDAGGGNDIIFSDRPNGQADNGFGNADWVIGGAGRDIIETGAGNDLIEAGSDGAGGGDIVDAGGGDDEIYAEAKVALSAAILAGNNDAPTGIKGDLLSGAAGQDWIIGGRANDLLMGGDGKDLIVGGAGDDDLWGDLNLTTYALGWQVTRSETINNGVKEFDEAFAEIGASSGAGGGADVIYGGAGSDWIFGGVGDDFIDAGADDDVAMGESGADILIGGAGNDVLVGDNPATAGAADEGGDYLDGGTGDDELFGQGGDDILLGGPGADTLVGGVGRDTYVFNRGDGTDVIVDIPTGPNDPEASVLIVGEGFSRSDIKFHLGSLLVDLGVVDPSDPNSLHDQIHFEGFDPFDPLTTPVLSEIRFASGESMTYADILAQGFDIDGTEEDDDGHDAAHPILVGTAVVDRIRGFGGNDIILSAAGDDVLDGGDGDDHLQAGEGNDVLIGGAGADLLQGEEGQDTYVADFEDTINDTSGGDLIDLGVETPEELTVARFDNDGQSTLVVSLNADGDPTRGLTILGDITTQDLRFAFASGELTSDEFFDIAFTSSLTLIGTDGDDTLRGFGGADTLDGLGGNDSLHGGAGNDLIKGGEGDDTLDGGAGNDVLGGEAGDDTYLFGHGSGQDEVNDAGGDGIDRIVLSVDVLPQDVTLERSVDGNLTLTLSPDDRLTVTGHYADEGNRIEKVVFGDGTVLTVQDLDAVPLPPITGTENADSLVGTNFPETLIGLGGDDTLDGGGGNDTVEGGDGIDTYAFGLGMGQDTFIDDGGRIVLRPGLGFNDLSAVRRGDDLELTIRGTTTGASLLNYFASNQNWIIENAVGLQTDPDAVLDATAQRAADWVSAQRDDYHAALKEQIASRYLSFGYAPTADGTFFLPWQARPSLRDVTAFASWNTQTETKTISFFSGGTTTTTTTSGFTSWDHTRPLLIDSTVRITEETLVSDDPEIFPFGGFMQTDDFRPIVASVSWEGLQADFGTISELTRTEFIFGGEINPNTGQPIAIGTVTTTTVFRNFSGVVDGKVIAIAPGAAAQGGLFPQFVNATLRLNTISEHISEVIAGPGDNEIFDASLIDAGDGNDIASGGFVYGGAGDDIIDAEVGIGGPGNDRVSGAKVYGGPGDDYLEGWFGPSRFIFDEQDSGRDTITDSQGLEIEELADWYYTLVGIPDWEDRLFDPQSEDHISIESGIEQGLLPPLPQFVANDWHALAPLYAAGLIDIDVVELRRGLGIGDVSFSWGEIASISPLSGVLEAYTTLDVSWNAGDAARIVIPHSDDPLGTGVEEVRFDDGSVFSMQELLAIAPPAPSFDPQDQDNLLLGTPHDDNIRGYGGNDTLGGGPGEDFLDGGTGDDVYLFAQGDEADVAFDEGGTDVVRFADGITPADVIFSVDYFGDATFILASGDSLRFSDWPNENSRIERVEFSDGTIWDSAQIAAHTTIAPSTEFDDFIGGTSGNDNIDALGGDDLVNGFAGDDVLFGNTGHDLLEGGAGSDILRGGEGDDSLLDQLGHNVLDGGAGDDFIEAYGAPYDAEGGNNFVIGGRGDDWILSFAANNVIAFNAGDGHDNVHVGYAVTLSLGAGISPSSLALSEEGGTLLLTIGAGDSIRLTREFDPDPNAWPQITLQMFGSVHFYDFNAVIAEFHAALAANPSLTAFPLDGVLQTHETGVSESLALGGPLAYLYGTTGGLNTLSDDEIRETIGVANFGATTQSIVVPGSNQAPGVDTPIADQTAPEDALFGFTLPASTFRDDDVGDTLTFDAVLVDGSPLPAWLDFDAASQHFSGTPGNDDVGAFEIVVTATDLSGESASDTFTLTVENTNDVPVLLSPLSDQAGNQNAPLEFSIPAESYEDIDAGDVLTFSAALGDGSALPAWLAFDPATRTLSGTPREGDVAVHLISVAATDIAGTSVAGEFELSITDAATTFASYEGTKRRDVIRTGFENDFIDAGKGDDWIASGAGRDLVLAGKDDDCVYGGFGNDYLLGGKGKDHLFGEAGNDVLFGEQGDDYLDGGPGNNVLDGGKGKDHIIGGAGNNLMIGGPGSDMLYGNSAHDVFLVNRGDGKATLHLDGASNPENTDTISLGKGVASQDIVLRRKNKDLVLSVAESDDDDDDDVKIVLENWYGSDPAERTVTRLQLIDDSVAIYDFSALAARYDSETGGRERNWRAGDAMGDTLLSISDTEAIGGTLAYQYAMLGTIAQVPTAVIQVTLADAGFGASSQLVVDDDGATLAVFLTGDDDADFDDFFALFSDPGFAGGQPPQMPEMNDEVQNPPHHHSKKERGGDDDDDFLESLIERWFGGDRHGSRSLAKLLNKDDGWGEERRNTGHGTHHWTQDEIAAFWRRTQKLLDSHLANHDPAALGGEDHGFSTGLGGGGYSQFVLSGDRLPRVSGHQLRRLEGLDEGLTKLHS